MKQLLISGIVLIIVAAGMPTEIQHGFPVSVATWMYQAGFILLLGALVVYFGEMRVKDKHSSVRVLFTISLVAMLFYFLAGFNSQWSAHPLGAIISVIGFIWVYHRLSKNLYPKLNLPKNIITIPTWPG